jgi:hypothetical protein
MIQTNSLQPELVPLTAIEQQSIIENNWKSCCLTVDKRAVLFFSQLSISILVILFCCFQLIRLENCEAQSLYSGILTLILGVWCPSPKMTKI